MQYMLLIYSDEKAWADMSPEAMEASMDEYNAYTDDLSKSGLMRAGDALHPTAAATTVRVQNGKSISTHGPFAETKEQLGG
ncbi:MAG: YciI family protein, partial [Roseiflexaceae bacterium]